MTLELLPRQHVWLGLIVGFAADFDRQPEPLSDFRTPMGIVRVSIRGDGGFAGAGL